MNGGLARSLRAAAGIACLALAGAWLWRLRDVLYATDFVGAAALLAAGLAAPRRSLAAFFGGAALLPILSAVVPGPDFSRGEIAWWVLAGAALLASWRRREAPAANAGPLAALALFLLWALFSAGAAILPYLPPGYRGGLARHLLASNPTNLDPLRPFFPVHAASVLAAGFLAFALAFHYFRTAAERATARRAFFLGAGAVSLYGVVEWVFGVKLWPAVHYDIMSGYHRVAATLPDPNALGSFLALAICWTAVARNRAAEKRRDLLGVLLAAEVAVLLLSGSRAAWLAVGGAGLVRLAAMKRRGQRWPVRGLALAALAAALALAVPSVRQRISLAAESHTAGEFFLGRPGFLRAGLRMIAAHPVSGVGVGRYYRDLDSYRAPDFWIHHENAHDYFLQVASETGLPGLALFLAALAGALIRRPPPGLEGLRAGVLAFLATMLAGHALLVPEVAVLVFFALGLLAAGSAGAARPALSARAVAAAAAVAVVAIGAAGMRVAAGLSPRFAGYGIYGVAEPGGPGGRPQFWTEDLFASRAPDLALSEPNSRYAGKVVAREIGSGASATLTSAWTAWRPGAPGAYRWFSTDRLWCPQREDPRSGDRRLLSVRVSPGPRP